MPDAIPKSDAERRAEKVVTQWLLDTWVSRPKWMTRMPDQKDIDGLLKGIATELELVQR